MKITYEKAGIADIEPIYTLCRQLIEAYEDMASIDYPKVMQWVQKKIETSIEEYTVICADGQKAGYYHFFRNEDGQLELDDLYVFPEYRNRGIGSEVVRKCCDSVSEPVMLYVFVRNDRAVALYRKLGFEVLETVHGTRYIMQKKQ